VIDLEYALTDLAEHLDHPAGDELVTDLRRRLTASTPLPEPGRNRGRVLLVAAAILVLIAAAVLAIPPSREAIADWLGIGAVEIRHTNQPPAPSGSNPVPGQTGAPPSADAAARLAAARTAVQFTIRTPPESIAGPLFDVDLDRRPRGGLVALTYKDFTLVEVASFPNQLPPLQKFTGPTTHVELSTVGGRPAVFITGAEHGIGYVDPTGEFALDTLRRAGPVLLWERGGVTHRIEGIAALPDARRIAESIG